MRRAVLLTAVGLCTCAPPVTPPGALAVPRSDAAPVSAEPSDPAAPPAASAPSLLGPWISFYAGFEEDVVAELASGEPRPRQVQGRTVFDRGRVGRALRLGVAAGGARIDYPLASNLDFSRPGALSFWISPRGWQAKAPPGDSGYVRFLHVVGRERSVFLVQREPRRTMQEALALGFFDLPGGEKHFLQIEAGPRWGSREWHLLVVDWDAAGFALSVDGAPFVRKGVPGERIRAFFGRPVPDATLVVGGRSREFSLLDELTIYARPLGDADVAALWQRGQASQAP